MNEALNDFFQRNLSELQPQTQSHVIDGGRVPVSTFDLASGLTRCILRGEHDQEILWELPFGEAEAAAMGNAVTAVLNTLSVPEREALNVALGNGGLILVAIEHIAGGQVGIHFAHAGRTICLAKLDAAKPVWQ